MKSISWEEGAATAATDDCLVVSQDANGKNNIITIGWKTIGVLWSKPVITIAVRPDRFSHSVIENGVKEFTINFGGTIEDHLSFCGTKSGRDVDKWAKTGLEPVKCKKIKVPIVKGAALSYACKIIHKADSGQITPHTLYFGEIIESYRQLPK